MIVFPKAKINIGLRITGKRQDGYHDIETLFYPISLRDALEFVVSTDIVKKDMITVTGITTGTNFEDNLVLKAIRRLREEYIFPVLKIHLHKVIPVGAGLGGGSSDAVSILKSINKCFDLNIDKNKLHALALELGSDCPFFIDIIPAFASGRGEILVPANPVLKSYYLLLLNPGVGINTREAYDNCVPVSPSVNLSQLVDRPITEWQGLILNDFETFAFRKYPLIGEIKDELYHAGALYSSMSGSGSSVYGIFSDRPKMGNNLKDLIIFEGLM